MFGIEVRLAGDVEENTDGWFYIDVLGELTSNECGDEIQMEFDTLKEAAEYLTETELWNIQSFVKIVEIKIVTL